MSATPPTNLQVLGQLSSVGFSFVLAIVMGFGGGYAADNWLGTTPWLAFLGFFVGLAAGVLNVYRVLQFANRRPAPPSPQPPGPPRAPGPPA